MITFVSLQFFSSCQDDIKELKEETPVDKSASFQAKGEGPGYDIDGGYLPEVEITARKKDGVEEDGGAGGSESLFDGWWTPSSGGDLYGGGGGSPSKVLLSTKLVRLFPKGTDLPESALTKLNAVFKEMLEDCTYKALTDLLLEDGYVGRKIFFTPTALGSAGVNRTGSLTFGSEDDIDVVNISHEWIHITQRYLRPEIWGDSAAFEKYYGMMEYENAVFRDIVWMLKNGKSMSGNVQTPPLNSWMNQVKIEGPGQTMVPIIYAVWLYGTFGNGVVPGSFDTGVYYEMSNYFFNNVRSNMNKGFQCEKSYGISALETLLHKVYDDCLKVQEDKL